MYERTRAAFERLGLAVALRPWRTIAISLTVTFMLTGGILTGQWEARLEYRDVPRGIEGFKLYDEVVIPLFGLTPRINEFKAYASDGGNALRKDLLLEALTVHEQVLGLSAAVSGEEDVTYGDICVRSFPGGDCKTDNVFLRLALDRQSLLAMDQAEIDARFLAQWRGLDRLLGRLEVDEIASTVAAANLRFFYLGGQVEPAKTVAAYADVRLEPQPGRPAHPASHAPGPGPFERRLLFPALLTPSLHPIWRRLLFGADEGQARIVAWESEFLGLLNPAGATGLDAATPPWESGRIVLAAVAGERRLL